MKGLKITIILFLLCFQSFGQTKKTDYSDILRLIDIWLDTHIDFDKLPGILVAIVQDQDIIFKKGYENESTRNCLFQSAISADS